MGRGGAGGFAAFFSRVVGGASTNALSPTGSDFGPQASTPVRSADSGLERAVSSTPAMRDAERTRALQLGGNGLTTPSGGRASPRARASSAPNACRRSTRPTRFPSHRSSPESRASSVTDSSLLDTSIAGDESYYLPAARPPSRARRRWMRVRCPRYRTRQRARRTSARSGRRSRARIRGGSAR